MPFASYRIALAVLAAAGPPTFSRPAAASETPASVTMPADLQRSVERFEAATIAKDKAILSSLVTDDFLLVNSDTSLQDKQSYLRDFDAPGFRIEPFVMRDRIVRMFGNSAITGGSFRLIWTLQDVRNERDLRVVHVWTRVDGNWRIAYTQLTRAAPSTGGR